MRITIQTKLSFEWDERMLGYIDNVDRNYCFDVDTEITVDCEHIPSFQDNDDEWYFEIVMILINGIDAPLDFLSSEQVDIIEELAAEEYSIRTRGV